MIIEAHTGLPARAALLLAAHLFKFLRDKFEHVIDKIKPLDRHI